MALVADSNATARRDMRHPGAAASGSLPTTLRPVPPESNASGPGVTTPGPGGGSDKVWRVLCSLDCARSNGPRTLISLKITEAGWFSLTCINCQAASSAPGRSKHQLSHPGRWRDSTCPSGVGMHRHFRARVYENAPPGAALPEHRLEESLGRDSCDSPRDPDSVNPGSVSLRCPWSAIRESLRCQCPPATEKGDPSPILHRKRPRIGVAWSRNGGL